MKRRSIGTIIWQGDAEGFLERLNQGLNVNTIAGGETLLQCTVQANGHWRWVKKRETQSPRPNGIPPSLLSELGEGLPKGGAGQFPHQGGFGKPSISQTQKIHTPIRLREAGDVEEVKRRA